VKIYSIKTFKEDYVRTRDRTNERLKY